LIRKGGMSGGATAAHSAGLLKSITTDADQIASRIRDANK
jgi:hypothetical protein